MTRLDALGRVIFLSNNGHTSSLKSPSRHPAAPLNVLTHLLALGLDLGLRLLAFSRLLNRLHQELSGYPLLLSHVVWTLRVQFHHWCLIRCPWTRHVRRLRTWTTLSSLGVRWSIPVFSSVRSHQRLRLSSHFQQQRKCMVTSMSPGEFRVILSGIALHMSLGCQGCVGSRSIQIWSSASPVPRRHRRRGILRR